MRERLERVAERHGSLSRSRAPLFRNLVEFGNAMRDVRPQASVRMPLLAVDHEAVLNDVAARRTVTASVREIYPFLSDQEDRLRAVQVQVNRGELVITAPSASSAVDAAAAYLTAERRKARPWGALPPTPVWAWASAAIALLSFGLSWAPLTWATLAALISLSAVVAATTIAYAPRLVARRSVTAWGLAPILTLVLFAGVYAATAMLQDDAITLNGTALHHLRDALLLSLSLLTTVGVLDLDLHQWVRSIAYLEMLLIAGLAGGAAVVALRRISGRVERIAEDLQRDREVDDRG